MGKSSCLSRRHTKLPGFPVNCCLSLYGSLCQPRYQKPGPEYIKYGNRAQANHQRRIHHLQRKPLRPAVCVNRRGTTDIGCREVSLINHGHLQLIPGGKEGLNQHKGQSGTAIGIIMLMNIRPFPAPSILADSISSFGSASK